MFRSWSRSIWASSNEWWKSQSYRLYWCDWIRQIFKLIKNLYLWLAQGATESSSVWKSFSGDLDTSHTTETEVYEDGNRFITGLTGKKILIRPEWKNESNIWNLGILDMKKIFPSQVSQNRSSRKDSLVWRSLLKLCCVRGLEKMERRSLVAIYQWKNIGCHITTGWWRENGRWFRKTIDH